jgi:cyclin-dependent kinase 12/13
LDQLTRIYDIAGTPNESNWPGVTKSKYFQQFLPKPKPRNLRQLFQAKKCSPQSIDLLDKMLTLDPAQRISAHEALKHDYFTVELPRPLAPNEHPRYEANYHEYNTKRRRRNREQQQAQQQQQQQTQQQQGLGPNTGPNINRAV